ncbi:hypothetical protein NGRA_0163 [Nosema granulosis]|uniref:Integrase catalytic domain-containing protein n=1 Tax=Nosema granulosis TaxID=83296 RepID=A0A9P6H1V6_9MICR|nr:hypothetical protein NGRA_0163 [Nosema granulosis]
MRIILTNSERDEIILWLLCETIPGMIVSSNDLKSFKKRASRFFYCTVKNQLLYKGGTDVYLRFFTLDEEQFKKDFITLIHVQNEHDGRDRLYYFLKSKAYGITTRETSDMVNGCEICRSRRALVTIPIIDVHKRERYIVDLVDFRYYSDVNDGVKWMLVMVDTLSKYMWTVPAIRTIFMTFGPCFLLHSDNGREFCNDTTHHLFSSLVLQYEIYCRKTI